MRQLKFTRDDIEDGFRSLITEGPAFRFGMSDIDRMRKEIATLISKLSIIYLDYLKKKEKANKKSKPKAIKSSIEDKKQEAGSDNTSGTDMKEDVDEAEAEDEAVEAPDDSGSDAEQKRAAQRQSEQQRRADANADEAVKPPDDKSGSAAADKKKAAR